MVHISAWSSFLHILISRTLTAILKRNQTKLLHLAAMSSWRHGIIIAEALTWIKWWPEIYGGKSESKKSTDSPSSEQSTDRISLSVLAVESLSKSRLAPEHLGGEGRCWPTCSRNVQLIQAMKSSAFMSTRSHHFQFTSSLQPKTPLTSHSLPPVLNALGVLFASSEPGLPHLWLPLGTSGQSTLGGRQLGISTSLSLGFRAHLMMV